MLNRHKEPNSLESSTEFEPKLNKERRTLVLNRLKEPRDVIGNLENRGMEMEE